MVPARIARHVLDSLARSDLSVFEAHCHPDAQFFRAGSDEPFGREQMRQSVTAHHTSFTDYVATVHEIIAEGDKVAVYFTSSGTHTTSWQGAPPTGNRIKYDELMILYFEGDRIIRGRLMHDSAALRQQLGLDRAPAADVSAAH